ncbi:MAG TPA: DUF1566 domain-containing protein [Steroidobacteraceae bacterium]|jgi:hypothetical protein
MKNRFVKVGETGLLFPRDATEWVVVLDRTSDLVWSRGFVLQEEKRWKAAVTTAAKFTAGDLKGFRAPTYPERVGLFDYSRFGPAMDTEFFDSPSSGWEWTATPYAPSPAVSAWFVYIYNGSSHWHLQYCEGFVRACAPRQSLGISAPEAA